MTEPKHLGRNPFGKKNGLKAKPEPLVKKEAKKEDLPPTLRNSISKPAEWLFVKLPAESFVFALKTALFVKGVFEKKD